MRGSSDPAQRDPGPERVILIVPSREISSELRALVEREYPGTAVTLFSSYGEAGAPIAGSGAVCLLEFGAQESLALAAALSTAMPVAAVLRENDPELMLLALRQGATGFLVPPFTAEQLAPVFAAGSRTPNGRREGPAGRVIAVLPASGGAGATTLACHLAATLGKRASGRVLLADLDGLTGAVSFLLKLRGPYSFADALVHPGKLDADLWKALVIPAAGIDVLLAPEVPFDGDGALADASRLLAYAGAHYEYVIADCSGAFGDWNASILRGSTGCLIVCTQESASVHGLRRALARLDEAGWNRDQTGIVLNRLRPRLPLSPGRIREVIGKDLSAVLPDCPETIGRALIEGRTAPAASRYGAAVRGIAEQLAGPERSVTPAGAASAVAGWLSRLCG